MKKEGRLISMIVLANIIVLFLGTNSYHSIANISISWAFGSITLINFWGLYYVIKTHQEKRNREKDAMKSAIAGTFITIYIMMIVVYIFTDIPTADSEVVKEIIGHFTYLVGIVMVSYFGTEAVTEYIADNKRKSETGDQ